PLSWLDEIPELLKQGKPAHILATSMVDLATIKGLHPALADVPVTLYFHENQFEYPTSADQHSSVDPQMVQLYAALAADQCLFNSQFNLDTFVAGIEQLTRRLPDYLPDNLPGRITARCSVLPVAVNPVQKTLANQKTSSNSTDKPLLVWNHRWEYDKRPDLLLELLRELRARGVLFDVALLGARAKRSPEVLGTIREEFAGNIIADGMVPRAEYEQLLARATVVFSSAEHEFQGLSVIEAVSAGAIPIVPDALCYREQYPAEWRYPAGNIEKAADLFMTAISASSKVDISAWTTETTARHWQQWADSLELRC
ncbi:MAG: DUF3524 domain-containing protein, partial [Thalassolituus sp.]